MNSQDFPVAPPPQDGKEYADKETDHATKPGRDDEGIHGAGATASSTPAPGESKSADPSDTA